MILSTVRIKVLDTLNLVKLANGGVVFRLEPIFVTTPAASSLEVLTGGCCPEVNCFIEVFKTCSRKIFPVTPLSPAGTRSISARSFLAG